MNENNHKMTESQMNAENQMEIEEKKEVGTGEGKDTQPDINIANGNGMKESKRKKEVNPKREDQTKKWNECKTKSDNAIKYSCYYLYWLMLNLKDTTEIRLKRRKHKKSKTGRIDHVSCLEIKVDGKTIYEFETDYVMCEAQNRCFPTIKIDEATQTPVIATTTEKRKEVTFESFKIQQHILIQIINNLLRPFFFEIRYDIKRISLNRVTFLHLKQYLDVREDGEFMIKDLPDKGYQEICEAMKIAISEILDDKTGKKKELVISEEQGKPSGGYKEIRKKVIVSREYFLGRIWDIRKGDI